MQRHRIYISILKRNNGGTVMKSWAKVRPKLGTNTKSHGSLCGIWGFSFRGPGDSASLPRLSVTGLFLALFALCGF